MSYNLTWYDYINKKLTELKKQLEINDKLKESIKKENQEENLLNQISLLEDILYFSCYEW